MNKKILFKLFLQSVIVSTILISCNKFTETDYLRDGFLNPPDSARPGIYWNFMYGDLTRQSITEDLESIENAGIGYLLFSDINSGQKECRVEFMSNEWQELFEHTVRECERLGITFILSTVSGGPWIKADQSMIHLVACDTILTGPRVYTGKLPLPKPEKPLSLTNNLPPELVVARDAFYEDVRVLAFPAPENQARIRNIEEKALFIRKPAGYMQGVSTFNPGYSTTEDGSASPVRKEKIIDVTINLKADGSFPWSVPPGNWRVIRFGKRSSGIITDPGSLSGPGFAADKFDTAAWHSNFNNYTGKLISRVKPVKTENGGGWTMIHSGGHVAGTQNWSHSFIEEFIKRRGYDPMLYLPVYSGVIINSIEESERFLWDVRKTASELMIDNQAGYLKQLGKRYGMSLLIDLYDMNPAADLDLGMVADIPAGGFGRDSSGICSEISCIEASSAGHVKGIPIIAAEAFNTCKEASAEELPVIIKRGSDWALAMGINRIIYNIQGDTLHAGRENGKAWKIISPGFSQYLSRCQFMLSQGKPAAEILYLSPEGAPHVFTPPSSALEGTDFLQDKRGYSFDACSPDYLINSASVYRKRIQLTGGTSYSVLILPDVPSMSPELITKIDRMLKDGAVMAGYAPKKSPSLTNYPMCDSSVRMLSRLIWRKNIPDTGTLKTPFGAGTMYRPEVPGEKTGSPGDRLYPSYEYTANIILKSIGVSEDFIASGNTRYIHRSAGKREIYYICNRTGQATSDSCFFRDGTMKAEIWDPVTSEILPVEELVKSKKGIGTMIRLEPWQSYFVVFYLPDTESKKRP